jgi:hypothetical protein
MIDIWTQGERSFHIFYQIFYASGREKGELEKLDQVNVINSWYKLQLQGSIHSQHLKESSPHFLQDSMEGGRRNIAYFLLSNGLWLKMKCFLNL